MIITRRVHVVLAATAVAAAALAAPAWAGGPGGVVENDDISRAVGSGVLDGALVGYSSSGADNAAASAAVIAACQSAGADQCSSDEVTNDVFCVVSVGVDDGSGIVAGGAGESVEAASADAVKNVGRANLTLSAPTRVLASSCP